PCTSRSQTDNSASTVRVRQCTLPQDRRQVSSSVRPSATALLYSRFSRSSCMRPSEASKELCDDWLLGGGFVKICSTVSVDPILDSISSSVGAGRSCSKAFSEYDRCEVALLAGARDCPPAWVARIAANTNASTARGSCAPSGQVRQRTPMLGFLT